ncbi:MAG: hypothetical protein RLZZ200_922 [Pseudomonadota bacterium]|jgi:hypothetical protein
MRAARTFFVIVVALCVAACSEYSAPGVATRSFSMGLAQEPAHEAMASARALPLYHLGPIELQEPTDQDQSDPRASASHLPHRQAVTSRLSQVSTRRLTKAALDALVETGAIPPSVQDGDSAEATPMASGTVVATYTPAQIRAAYGLPALPAAGSSLSAAQAAQLGAGQTIYIVDAQHDPNVAVELAAFNTKFGLPGCTAKVLSTTTKLPLPAASTKGCSLLVAYATTSGGIGRKAPAYESGWATEIALDVQWAHATAPLARIVLIEAPDAMLGNMLAAVKLANRMGPGVVSMSFGAVEGSWTASVDSAFSGTGMSYFAAAGDAGSRAEWPAVSQRVVAVGGTSLSWAGVTPRRETVWSLSGGARSAYVAAPAYQTSAVPGLVTSANRAVSDVAFNADPSTGQYVVTIAPGSTKAGWVSAGGTSLSTPQWAGIAAIANAMRAATGQALLGMPHTSLYGISAQPSLYSQVFTDVSSGSNGSCVTCFAGTGYDLPTGLGTPNVGDLLSSLAVPVSSGAPTVVSSTVSGTRGVALTFPAMASAANPVTYSLNGAPVGVSISSAGVVTWPSPTLGTSSVVVTARDAVNGLTGQGTYSVVISEPTVPVVYAEALSTTAGSAFTYAVQVAAAHAVTYALADGPTGLLLNQSGILTWETPVAGRYTFTVTALDLQTGLAGQTAFTLDVSAPQPPVMAAGTVSGVAGRALSYSVSATSSNPLSFSLSGAPAAVAIDSGSGLISWASPIAGTYTVTVTATDRITGLSASATISLSIAPGGPVLSADAMYGTVGSTLTGSIYFSDATSTTLYIEISGVPNGMSLVVVGSRIDITWTPAAAGTWPLVVDVRDGDGLTASLTVPVVVR